MYWVTCVSTRSADRPGASVWITTCVGENSGNTSTRARCNVKMPYATSIRASATTTPGKRTENRTMAVIMIEQP